LSAQRALYTCLGIFGGVFVLILLGVYFEAPSPPPPPFPYLGWGLFATLGLSILFGIAWEEDEMPSKAMRAL